MAQKDGGENQAQQSNVADSMGVIEGSVLPLVCPVQGRIPFLDNELFRTYHIKK